MVRLAKIFVLSLVIVFPFSNVFSQTFDEFKNQIREEYDTFEKETQDKFDNFVEGIDKEFATYLSENFGSYDIGHEEFKPDSPKPAEMPEAEEVINDAFKMEYVVKPTATTFQASVYPSIKKSEDSTFPIKLVNVRFLGWPLEFKADKAYSEILFENPSPESISKYWKEMADVNYNHLLFQISEVANTLNINQWGYFQLLKSISEQIYPADKNLQVLFQWAMLSRSRYKVKVGYSNNNLFLLIPSIYKMYNIDYVKLNDIDYYVLDGKGEKINTYEKDFPESDKIMDVTIKSPFYTDPIKKSKEFKFNYDNTDYKVRLDFDGEMINFYKTIPLSDVSVYFNSVINSRSKNSIKEAFTPILTGKSDIEKINILLSFVQQAFDYKTDQQVFGTERYFFADELLNYPYADCEDRSILLCYLVKTLVNKDAHAVSFPGHMAVVVNVEGLDMGYYINYTGNYYYMADPTLMGAKLGSLMPGVSDEKAQVILLNNSKLKSDFGSKAWSKTNTAGGFKADNLNDLIFDKAGNIYVCGYFTESINFNNETINAVGDGRDMFVLKYDNKLNPVWIKTATGKANDLGLSLAMDNDENLYVYGSFENDLKFDNLIIEAINAPDVFVAKYTKDGNLLWAKKAGLDKLDHSIDLIFAAKFSSEGEKIMAKLYSQTENFDYYGIDVDENQNAFIKGSFYATTGMNKNDFINYNNLASLEDIPEALYLEDKKLKEKEYEETIAGVFAALNLLKSNTIEINGSNIVKTFDVHNDKIKDYAPNIYNSFKGMKFLKNDKGIISIKTSNGEPVIIDKIKITNDARIKVIVFKSQNVKVEVLSGVYVGGGDYWLDMNSIKLFKESGDLLFDFDTDNSVQKINLKKEILKYQ